MFIDQLPDIRDVQFTHGRTTRDQTGKNYVIYCRQSDESDDRNKSIPDQILQCLHLAKMNGLNVIGVVQEQISARNHGRPRFNNLINAIKGTEELDSRYLEPL